MLGIRRALLRAREAAEDLHAQIRSDFAPMPSMELFSFRGADDVARFQVTTDRVLGGRSSCSFSLKSYANFTSGCFTGTIDYEDENPSSRGGFASFRTRPEERVRDVTASARISPPRSWPSTAEIGSTIVCTSPLRRPISPAGVPR